MTDHPPAQSGAHHYQTSPPQPGHTYGQPAPGQPGLYAPPWPTMPEPRNGFGLTALIVGIIGMLFGLVPFTGFIAFGLGVVGLIFGLANLGRLKRRRATNPVTTGFGIATSVGAVALGIIGMVIFFSAMNDLGNDLDEFGTEMDCISEAETVEQMDACEQP